MAYANKIAAAAAAAVMSVSSMAIFTVSETDTAFAAASYPVQEFRMGIGDTNRSVSISEAENGAYLNSQKDAGTRNEKWHLNFVSDGVYEIVNSATGYVVTNQNGLAVLSADTDRADQRWRITGTDKDHEGYYLYYKIVSNANPNAALTFNQNSNSIAVSDYSGNIYQKYKLNLDGLEGYAANAKVSQGEKAGTIGGLLGETVFVDTNEEFTNAIASLEPLTVVLTADLDFCKTGQIRVRDYKTIVGAYGVTLKDCQLRTNNAAGNDSGNKPSDNIVIRNLTLKAKDSTNCQLIAAYSSRNLWIDHCTFVSELNRHRDEVGKFIWINTPYDGVDLQRSPDYITISYCSFNNRYWTVAYGTQNGETSRCRTTLMYNWWNTCARRTPQIGNGTGHIYNSYHSFSGSEPSDQIIGGDGSNILSENCRFEGLSGYEIEGGGSSSSPYTDSGSYTGTNRLNHNSKYKSSLNPSNHYGYSMIEAYNTNGTDTKSFCTAYAGAFRSYDKIKYITDSDLSKFVSKKYDNPFLKDIEVGDEPVAGAGASFDTSHKYRIINAASGLNLEVADSAAENGANVQQGNTGADGWILEEAGNGYYYVYSELGGGNSYVLDLAYGKPENGTNIGIWSNTKDDSKMFKFIANDDGTYTIATKSTADKSCLGTENGSTEIGANVLQWSCDGSANQKWNVEIKVDPQNGRLIKNLVVKDLATYKNWRIDESAAVGDMVYGDRDNAEYSAIPAELLGAEMIVPACDAKNSSDDLASFTAGSDMTVYAAFDARVSILPEWLTDWTETTMAAENSRGVTYKLYQLDCRVGDTVTLGTNGQSASCVNYTVFAVEKQTVTTTVTTTATTTTTTVTTTTSTVPPEPGKVKGDVNADGSCSVADIVAMQKYLLHIGTLTDTPSGDVNEDGRINVFDLMLMKRMLKAQ